MSVEHIAAVLHHSRATGTAKVVLIGIANHAGDGGSWPTVATLARYANVHPRKVQEAIKRLEDLGEVTRHVQAGGDHRIEHDRDRPNLYEVLVECPEGCRGDANHRPRDGWRREADGTYSPVDNGRPSGGAGIGTPADTGTPTPADTGTQTITRTSDATGSASVTGPRASAAPVDNVGGVRPLDTRTCEECSAPDERACLRRQIKLDTEHRHPYAPRDETSKNDTGSAGDATPAGSAGAELGDYCACPAADGLRHYYNPKACRAPRIVGAHDEGDHEHNVESAGNASSAAPTEEA